MRVELRGVRKRYGAFEALRGIDGTIPSGRRVALVGPNGSGKSTLLRALMGLVACEGEVLLDGLRPFADRRVIAERLAYVPQVAPQLGAPVRELVWALSRTRGVAAQRVADLSLSLGLSLAEIAERPYRALSGGMKQKVLLALALAAPADLLILDEPTASLDAPARERFSRLISGLPEHVTVLLCSHRVEEVREHATHVLELADGRVAFDGPIARPRLEVVHG